MERRNSVLVHFAAPRIMSLSISATRYQGEFQLFVCFVSYMGEMLVETLRAHPGLLDIPFSARNAINLPLSGY